ncbi:MAG: hypothetical protein GY940_13490, partial [bacterium]|nr:hypothetical protein [bacterium]
TFESSIFITLLTLINVLLHRFSGQSDILVGSPIAGRNHPDLRDQIGLFVNTLVFRNRFNPENSFTSFFNRVRHTAAEAYQYQDYPFDHLVEELNPPKNRNRNPFFDVMLLLESEGRTQFKPDHITAVPVEIKRTHQQFALLFAFRDTGSHIQGTLGYRTGIFEEGIIQRLIDSFKIIVSAVSNA